MRAAEFLIGMPPVRESVTTFLREARWNLAVNDMHEAYGQQMFLMDEAIWKWEDLRPIF